MLDLTIAEAQEIVLKPSYELGRALFMGWTFGKPTIQRDIDAYRLCVSFTCVCGRREEFHYRAERLEAFRFVDVAHYLTEHGSFSRRHLLQDGYTEQQVREIERKGEEFDRVTREHWEREIMRAGGFDEFQMQRAMRSTNAR